MKRRIPLSIILILIFLAVSCNSDNEPSAGSISISIEDSISRTIQPTVSLDVSKYVIMGKGPKDASFQTETDVSKDSVNRENLLPGTWSLHAIAYKSSGKAIGEGNASVTVTAGKTSEVIISVAEYEGTGTITIVLSQSSAEYNAIILFILNKLIQLYYNTTIQKFMC